MDYNEAMDYIHGTLKFGSKLGLHNIGVLLDLMGNPHKKLKYVHVAGTNGKGSTVAFISSILEASGYRVGIYTSPFIQRFTERIKINKDEISKEELARLTSQVKEKVDLMVSKGENHPTEFEIVTAIAFQYFYESGCDIVVLEVGLGGRFDSTNIIDTPDLAVITTISYDHMDRLGNTLSSIAFEKAGIIKPGCDVISYEQQPEASEVIQKACRDRNARLNQIGFSGLKPMEFGIDGQIFDYEEYKTLEIKLLGEHQLKNAAVSVKAAQLLALKGYNITEATIRKGLKDTRWPGRLEVLKVNPAVLVDGAHNVEGAVVLRKALDKYFPGKRLIFIMGVLVDKDYKAMMETVLPGCSRVITITPNSSRALPASELASSARAYCKNVYISDTIEEAIRLGLQDASSEDIICAFGSLYYIGAVRELFGL
jgi:folylpolyglutamate synthase/dihydrofolate synthase